MVKELYGWQEEFPTRWFTNGGRGMVQAATGSGKTLVALTAAERLKKKVKSKPACQNHCAYKRFDAAMASRFKGISSRFL